MQLASGGKNGTFYHSTIDTYAKQIERVGIKPRVHALELRDSDGDELRTMEGEDKPFVYLGQAWDWAEDFARFRAEYARAAKGTWIAMNRASAYMQEKLSDVVIPNAKPVVLQVELPENYLRKLQADPQCRGAVCYPGTIPASRITKVIPIQGGK